MYRESGRRRVRVSIDTGTETVDEWRPEHDTGDPTGQTGHESQIVGVAKELVPVVDIYGETVVSGVVGDRD